MGSSGSVKHGAGRNTIDHFVFVRYLAAGLHQVRHKSHRAFDGGGNLSLRLLPMVKSKKEILRELM